MLGALLAHVYGYCFWICDKEYLPSSEDVYGILCIRFAEENLQRLSLKRLATLITAVAVILIVTVAAFTVYSNQSSYRPVQLCSPSFQVGHWSEYGGGSSTACYFKTAHSSQLTGAFDANASLQFFVFARQEYSTLNPSANPLSIPNLYSSGNVRADSFNVSLPAGSYVGAFYFTYSYQISSPTNGTGTAGATRLNITEDFVATM